MKRTCSITLHPRVLEDHALHTEYDVFVGKWKIGKLIEWPHRAISGVRFFGHWFGTDRAECFDFGTREAFILSLEEEAA